MTRRRNEKWSERQSKRRWLSVFMINKFFFIIVLICTMFSTISPCIASSCRVFLWMNAGDSRVASHLNVHSSLAIHALGFIFYDIISSFSPSQRFQDFSASLSHIYLFYLHLLSRMSCLSCSVQLSSKVYVKYRNEKKSYIVSLSLSVIYNLTSPFEQFTRFIFFPFRLHTTPNTDHRLDLLLKREQN